LQIGSKIYVAGHLGLAGSAIVRELREKGCGSAIVKTHQELDLCDRIDVYNFFDNARPEQVYLCAAHAGGISEAINNSVGMLSDNLLIQTNVINACHKFGVKKLLFLGSSCIYPVDGEQPYREEQLGTGKTDENWSYAVAKLAGIELCRAYHRQHKSNFITAIPCNMYGINDNFKENGHVIPSLMRKIIESDNPEIWSMDRRREFLYVDDFAEAAVMLMEKYDYEHLCDGVINVGSSHEYRIEEVANILKDIIKPNAEFIINHQAPAGVVSKLMDSSRINSLGWKPKTFLREGIKAVYEWHIKNSTHHKSI
jgi:GDP-L-fucose synthase